MVLLGRQAGKGQLDAVSVVMCDCEVYQMCFFDEDTTPDDGDTDSHGWLSLCY